MLHLTDWPLASSLDECLSPVLPSPSYIEPTPMMRPLGTPILVLPDHLLLNVATQLDRPTAIQVACTCTQLRPYGEAAAWRELNISVHRSFHPNPLPQNMTRPLGGSKIYAVRESFSWGPTEEWEERSFTDGDGLEQYYDSLLALLKRKVSWRKAVRAIYIDIDRLLSSGSAELIKITASTLTCLELIPPGFPYDPNPSRTTCTPRQLFDSLACHTLDKLEHLRLPIDRQWDDLLIGALKITPNLRSLRICANNPYSGSWGDTMTFDKTTYTDDEWPQLLRLKELEIDEMSPEFVPMLVAIIQSSPKLRRMSIRDPTKAWQPKPDDALLEAISSSPNIKYFGCLAHVLPRKPYHRFQALEEVSVVEEKQSWGLAQLEMVFIPALQNMKILYSYPLLQNEARAITWAWESESRGLPAPIRPISFYTLQALKNAPSLLLIQMPSSLDHEWRMSTSEDWSYWGSNKCAADHNRAVLIRSYRHPTGQQFFHCRSYSAHHSHIDEGVIHRSEHVWEEHTDYEGWKLPASILAEVYAVMGQTAGWTVPQRDLTMPDAAWEILRKCKELEEKKAYWALTRG